MSNQFLFWSKVELRRHQAVILGELAPTMVLKNATYLNTARHCWTKANIWIYDNRIVYVGDNLPQETTGTEMVELDGKYVVPGYIEPHAHPFQLYNPQTLGDYASVRGTTTFICDNLKLFLSTPITKALSLMEDMNKLPYTYYWWCRFDSQSELLNEDALFSLSNVKKMLSSPYVIQGGELTSWPKVMQGDDNLLHYMRETRRAGKRVEGHLPGASEKTLTQMALLGVDCDHEAMTGEEAMMRLNLGLTTSLRYSSIRPDLRQILREMNEMGAAHFDRVIFTTDGSTPAFYEEGVTDKMISIALEEGIDPIDAYKMASYNIARYYGKEHILGMVAPGRVAHLNILDAVQQPNPEAVLAKGQWIKRDGKAVKERSSFPWNDYGMGPLDLNWDLTLKDFQFSSLAGIDMVNSVITKPYHISLNPTAEKLDDDHDECFFMLVDKKGKWRVNTLLKGFATSVSGFASSYSSTGDILLIGKSKRDMLAAFNRIKEMKGGIVLVEDRSVVSEIKLPIAGGMSPLAVEELIEEEKKLTSELRKRGYAFEDPIYSLLFFSSTHLPYVRITQLGLYDVKKKVILFPSIMR
ncbi:adenine deaminase C-terminal domain-containing protein [Fictibacillus enclensis]|uniref:adenine deaminase C-terminal domain-containing protein n=1 Tax=Fictibacillus enclensis TaxID=1017270 RepID=UPI0025A1B0F2|nr:adenine deaminase C-terminal domain-containing protein [Fictibacillus enclensis]MDM5197157.1 adenine deaminase C-terminal domain-containing protein [Fictibacillus enclensis]